MMAFEREQGEYGIKKKKVGINEFGNTKNKLLMMSMPELHKLELMEEDFKSMN